MDINDVLASGPFAPSWESWRNFTIPDWYQDAKGRAGLGQAPEGLVVTMPDRRPCEHAFALRITPA
jgi:hypothetical protein